MTDLNDQFRESSRVTGWEPEVISYLYDEYVNEDAEDDFFEYLADLVGNAAFVIAASQGIGLAACLEAYAHGVDSVLDKDFLVDEAIDQIYEVATEG
jgi:hypothetical protein